jgi:dihydrofolate reductase
MRLALVVAVANNGVIGRGGALPWHLPDDLKHFKRVTMGKPILMGRRTFESIGKPLPGRRNLVLTRGDPVAVAGVESVKSLKSAMALCVGVDELCVIGGAAVYAAALPFARVIYLTRVESEVPGDVQFPAVDWKKWKVTMNEHHAADARHVHAMTFQTLERMR